MRCIVKYLSTKYNCYLCAIQYILLFAFLSIFLTFNHAYSEDKKNLDHNNPEFKSQMRSYLYSLEPAELRCVVDWVRDHRQFQKIFDDPKIGPLLLSGLEDAVLVEILSRSDAEQLFESYLKAKQLLNMPKMIITPENDITLYRDGFPFDGNGTLTRPTATSSLPNPGGGIYVRPGNITIQMILPKGVATEVIPIPNTFQEIGHNEKTLSTLGLGDLYQPPQRNIGGFASLSNEILIPPRTPYEVTLPGPVVQQVSLGHRRAGFVLNPFVSSSRKIKNNTTKPQRGTMRRANIDRKVTYPTSSAQWKTKASSNCDLNQVGGLRSKANNFAKFISEGLKNVDLPTAPVVDQNVDSLARQVFGSEAVDDYGGYVGAAGAAAGVYGALSGVAAEVGWAGVSALAGEATLAAAPVVAGAAVIGGLGYYTVWLYYHEDELPQKSRKEYIYIYPGQNAEGAQRGIPQNCINFKPREFIYVDQYGNPKYRPDGFPAGPLD
jgi:hypothetical protein